MTKQKNNSNLQKTTIRVTKQLLADAQKIVEESIVKKVKNGSRLLIATKAAKDIQKMKGKIKFSIDINELREDKCLPLNNFKNFVKYCGLKLS